MPLDRPPGQHILVLAPHPDDDVIGCGGTLSKHVAAGSHVTSVYLTDGGRGDPECGDPAQVARVRRQEAEAAAEVLELNDLVFLNGPDGALAPVPELIRALQRVLTDRQPDLVYVPFFLDPHPDHRATNDVLAAVVAAGDFCFRCCAYESWSPLVSNVLVDISTQMPRKLAAVRCYRSQVQQIDYVRLVEGLNTYRTVQFSRRFQYAEAFYLDDVCDYLAMVAQMETT
jgi:LmbE family N-acetylglucosaminyl deacetylase